MKVSLFIAVLVVFVACNSTQTDPVTTEDFDITAFEQSKVSGADLTKLIRKGETGQIVEDGFMSGGKQTGTWSTYFKDNGKLESVTSYLNGKKNGPSFKLDSRGRLIKVENYLMGELNGLNAEYKNGASLRELMYANGKLDGLSKEYTDRGKLFRTIEFKEGEIHGAYKYFDDQGNLTMEYQYKNGKKVAGGIVEPSEKDETSPVNNK
jgi:antitoxin component YwqK of YwqJK toxin-antitoxin module